VDIGVDGKLVGVDKDPVVNFGDSHLCHSTRLGGRRIALREQHDRILVHQTATLPLQADHGVARVWVGLDVVDGEERLAFVGEVGQAASGLDHAVQKHGLTEHFDR